MFSAKLQQEIESHFEEWDGTLNKPNEDVILYDILNQILTDEEATKKKEFTKEIREHMIAQGVFIQITQEELNKSNKKKPDFKLNDKMYRFHCHPQQWVEWFYPKNDNEEYTLELLPPLEN